MCRLNHNGRLLREAGYDIYSLAIVDAMSEEGITFREH